MADIGVDLDGNLMPFHPSVAAELERQGIDSSLLPPVEEWHFYRKWNLTDEDFVRLCDAAVDTGRMFRTPKPYAGAREALLRLKAAGHRLHIVTDRSFGAPGMAALSTYQWLDEHQIPYDSVTFTADKSVIGWGLDYFIDDKIENYDAIDETGCEVYLMDQPWNRTGAHWTKRRRVASLGHFVDIVESREARAKADAVAAWKAPERPLTEQQWVAQVLPYVEPPARIVDATVTFLDDYRRAYWANPDTSA